MKSIYWRPQKVSAWTLFVIGFASYASFTVLFSIGSLGRRDSASAEVAAAQLADRGLVAIQQRRIELGHPIDVRFDPHRSGVIGAPISAATSKAAQLSAKQVSVNPNFAVAVLRMLRDAGVERGDTIAVGWSGSFPALNVALCAAIESLDLRPIAIASAMSSQYGANLPDYLWVDMEAELARRRIIHFRSSALTLGGAGDQAAGQTEEAVAIARAAQQRCDISWLNPSSLRESIEARMTHYEHAAGERKITAYINVGGGIASMGGSKATMLQPGLNIPGRRLRELPDSVARRFADAGIPIIHLAQARKLAKAYRLNVNTELKAQAGLGPVFSQRHVNRWLAAGLVVAIVSALHAFVSRDYGYRAWDWILVRLTPKRRRHELRVVRPSGSQLMA